MQTLQTPCQPNQGIKLTSHSSFIPCRRRREPTPHYQDMPRILGKRRTSEDLWEHQVRFLFPHARLNPTLPVLDAADHFGGARGRPPDGDAGGTTCRGMKVACAQAVWARDAHAQLHGTARRVWDITLQVCVELQQYSLLGVANDSTVRPKVKRWLADYYGFLPKTSSCPSTQGLAMEMPRTYTIIAILSWTG